MTAMKATKMQDSPRGGVAELAEVLAERGRAVVLDSNGRYAVIETTACNERPRRVAVLTSENYADAVREASA